MLKPYPLPALGEADGKEEKVRDESNEDEAGDASNEAGDASDKDGQEQSRVNKHGAQISKIKRYTLNCRPAAGVRTLGQEK